MSVSSIDLSSKFALDTKGMGDLKQSAKAGSPEALKGAATQFEAMFINMMMKSMREATPQDELTGSEQTKMFTGMLDQQMSQNMAKRGVGLADMLIRQLSSQAAGTQALAIGGEPTGRSPTPTPTPTPTLEAMMSAPAALAAPAAAGAPSGVTHAASGRIQAPHVRAFQEKLAVHAQEAERSTGIPAKFMLSQAALETGWGKREIRHQDGSSANNLFGIKAGPGWKGKVATAVTTEYVNGVPQTRVEKFRAYDSYADSFKDYAKLITNNPRYEKVLANAKDAAGFAQGLQQAGYATDPQYAAKLSRIIKHNLA
ncbi:flagellar assembly peptidoglycan hydrolase FlgJ [Massilia sp. TWP1-3-3]|uniref:flagellar assembly peptidoglycan hydrolase FlgJ n=1 Tax=Massilia sp. TWP1-3-3 TaxID=2804573 RepID=UPI003CF3AEFA